MAPPVIIIIIIIKHGYWALLWILKENSKVVLTMALPTLQRQRPLGTQYSLLKQAGVLQKLIIQLKNLGKFNCIEQKTILKVQTHTGRTFK